MSKLCTAALTIGVLACIPVAIFTFDGGNMDYSIMACPCLAATVNFFLSVIFSIAHRVCAGRDSMFDYCRASERKAMIRELNQRLDACRTAVDTAVAQYKDRKNNELQELLDRMGLNSDPDCEKFSTINYKLDLDIVGKYYKTVQSNLI